MIRRNAPREICSLFGVYFPLHSSIIVIVAETPERAMHAEVYETSTSVNEIRLPTRKVTAEAEEALYLALWCTFRILMRVDAGDLILLLHNPSVDPHFLTCFRCHAPPFCRTG